MAMIQMQDTELRKKIVRFRNNLTRDTMDTLHSSISELDGTTKIEVEALLIAIEYEFPIACFADIWQLISKSVSSSCITSSSRLRFSLISFAEENEREHLLYPRHWFTYVEDIYVHYFDYHQDRSGDVRKQLWRRYRKNS